MSLYNGESVYPRLAQFFPTGGNIPPQATEGGMWYDDVTHQYNAIINGVVTPISSGTSSVTKTLTSAQILTIFSSPVQLLPAAGPNMSYLIESSQSHFRFVTTAYTIAGMGQLKLFGTSYASGYWGLGATSLINQSVESYSPGGFLSVSIPATTMVNQPVFIGAGSANPTLGDGLLTVTVFYRIINGSLT